MKRDKLKTVVALLAGAYFSLCVLNPSEWRLIDGVNLLMHEAGHVIFMPLGQFIMIAGGSLFQVIVPATFVFYFYRNDQPYSAALVLFWAGQSVLNVSVYAGDSLDLALPLLGGQDSIHDWNYMLGETGLLKHTRLIARILHLAGALTIAAAAFLALKNARGSDDAPV